MQKSDGKADPRDEQIINWTIKMNGKMTSINNAVFTDFVGENHELIKDSVSVIRGKWGSQGWIIDEKKVEPGIQIKDRDSKGEQAFSISLGNLNEEGVQVTYQTKILDGFKAKKYHNRAQLEGTEFFKEESKVYEAKFSAGGTGSGELGSLKILKRDADDSMKYLGGAEFKLVEKDTKKVVQENITTDKYGSVLVKGLKYRKYLLTETKAPEGYELNTEPNEIEISENKGEAIEITVENKPNRGSMEITKVDAADGNTKLPNAEFTIYNEQGQKVATGKTDEKGIATFENLPFGRYKYRETIAPEGYLINETEFTFELSKNRKIIQQTVEDEKLPSIKTTATDKYDGTKEMHANKTVTIQDKVEYKDLLVGKEYLVKGKLMDKETNKPLVVGGKEVIAEAKLTPERPTGSITLDFTFDATGLEEKEVVVFEDLIKAGKTVTTHADINDESQTIKFVKPAVQTTATDKADGTKELHTTTSVTIQDNVKYENLVVGKEYTVKGKLMDKATNQPLLVDGKEVTAEAKLVPTEANGFIPLDFTFDATGLEEKEVVAFEDVWYGDLNVATHADIEDKGQTVKFVKPAVQTTATDKADGTKELHTTTSVTIQDNVTYENLVVGKEYTVKGKLMDKTTNQPLLVDGKEVTAEAKLVPTEANGSIPLDFTFDATGLEEKEVVAFEDVWYGDSNIATHADIEDKGQTVKFVKPAVQTTATDKADGTKELHTTTSVTIQDNVTYENLVVGKEYTVKGKLMDKATNQPLLVDGKEVVKEEKLVPTEANGSILLEFTFDATGLEEKEVVVFEDVWYGDSNVATHADIEDKGQTVKFVNPAVQTTATDKADGTKELHTTTSVTIQDNVTYENLVVGKEYTVKGKLMDKATNQPLLVDGKEVVKEEKLVPTEANGSILLEFTFDATGLEEKEVVVFEDVWYGDSNVATHADIEDKGQTVKFVNPAVQTTATDKADGSKELHTTTSVTIQDNVTYENLVVGKEYTVKGKLMDKATNQPLLVDGKEVTAESKLVPTEANGFIPLDFTFDATGLEEKEVVVFEDVVYADSVVAAHADIEDKGQTVQFVNPTVKTTATNKADGIKEMHTNQTVTIQDKVEYTDLIVGREYTVKGKLMDKATNKPLVVGGKEITAEATFTAEKKDGSITLDFTLDASELQGKEVVVFEDVVYADSVVATHADIEDKGQTVQFVNPTVKTTATNKADGIKEMHTNQTVTIQDKVEYTDLIVGREYTVKGKLMDKATNKPLVVGGKEITAEATFTAEKKDGSITLDFTLDASELQGKEVVVFEDVVYADSVVATHADIEDKDQTIQFVNPTVKTTATNKADGIKEMHTNQTVTIQDKVEYTDLIVGKEYTVKGKLMDKATNKPLTVDDKEITAEATFTAEKKDGSITLDFTLDASELQGKEVVVFEDLLYEGYMVAVHADMEDKGQTVKFVDPAVKTTATNKADGSKGLDASKLVTIQDKVEYTDLIVGKEYTVKGKLMDKATNKPLLVGGKEVTAEAKFTTEKKDGSITLDFTFDASELQGKEVVVFEDLLYEGNMVAVHADINDESQTVKFKVKPEQPKHEIAQTGGSVSKLPLIGFVLLAGAFFALVLARRNKKNKEN
ncbi:VaFE repeat-containing surface-anchored protein [Bacillus cereus group sp. MG7w]